MSSAQAAVAARIPGAAALGLLLPTGAAVVPATALADPGWTAQVLDARTPRHRPVDRRVVATVWWYSASSVLVTPPLAGLVTGIPLSARLADLTVALLPGYAPMAAVARGSGSPELAADLRTSLAAVIAVVSEAGGVRERPLWALAADSVANQLLALGRATGDVAAATACARPLAEAVGAPLPLPRYEDVGGARFTRRASCCLLYRLPGGALCTSCPRRPPEERRELLEQLARRW
ncbi:(2Fe-2S)-binding protein [Blastococcus sp. CCUG 61487]|uniref:(2Fe-2S)-binding protein n=1 Tax=Blastococcus sp. CCUG 61487 TaxID=1840703 RepID=UPI0010C0ED08|nr:(2Fe-2S)-binding protein [Blastococcus sp. CCUG 61487]TKJ18143.1 iron reductase [Blastococcus sp. CCUG 61487]